MASCCDRSFHFNSHYSFVLVSKTKGLQKNPLICLSHTSKICSDVYVKWLDTGFRIGFSRLSSVLPSPYWFSQARSCQLNERAWKRLDLAQCRRGARSEQPRPQGFFLKNGWKTLGTRLEERGETAVSSPRLALVAFRAKCRVRLAWPIKHPLCRLVFAG